MADFGLARDLSSLQDPLVEELFIQTCTHHYLPIKQDSLSSLLVSHIPMPSTPSSICYTRAYTIA